MASRRDFVINGLCTALCVGSKRLAATPELRDAAIAEITRGTPVSDGRVHLTIPAVAENGLAVYTTIAVDSPMTRDDHVRAIHIVAEANPIARLVTFRLGPRTGEAKVSTNIRLAASQNVTALAELSDGTFWRDVKPVIVTLAACIDGG
jgi:sulfur-oxidizing protein SoxY